MTPAIQAKEAFSLHLLMAQEDFPALEQHWEGKPINKVAIGDLLALGHWVALEELNSFEELSQDLEWISKQAIAHDQYIRQVATHVTVLPFKLGSFFSSEALLLQRLQPHESGFMQQIRALRGKQEWSVKLYGRQELLSDMAGDEELAQLEAEMHQASAGKAFLLRKKWKQLQAEKQEQYAEARLQRFYEQLQGQCLDLQVQKILSQKVTQKDESMLFNTAVLIAESSLDDWDRWVGEQQEHWNSLGIELAVSGPWPPYHFTKSLQA